MSASVTVKQIAKAIGLSESQVKRNAARDGWSYEEKAVRGGRQRHYPIASLPKPVADALLTAKVSATLPVQRTQNAVALPVATSLKDYQRLTMLARAAILAEIDALVMEGFSQGKAVSRLVEMAAADELRADLAALIPTANARSGNGGRKLSRATLYNWLKDRAKANGNALALAPARVPETAIPAWAGPLMDLYARPTKPSLAWAVEELAARLPDAPSYDQARRFLGRLDTITRHAGRMGPRALKSYRAYVARDVSELWPGAVYVADGHCFDAEVAHPRHGRPFRPEITAIVDVFTRRIVGWSLGLAENAWDVTAAAVNAFTTSTVCDIWYADNGPGFNNRLWDDNLTGLVARLGITKRNSIPYNSQARGVIERLHQTAWVTAAKRLVTYMGAAMDDEARQRAFKVSRREIKASGKSRLMMEWPDFVEFCADTVARYNAHPHSSLPKIRDLETGKKRPMTPDEMWADAIAKGWTPDVVPEDQAVDLFRPYEKRQTRRGLVELFGNSYFAIELEGFGGEDVLVGYDTTDASRVWVRAIDGRFIAVAKFEGNKASFFPVPVAEQAREKRAAGRLARLEAKRTEVIAELRPETLLEHRQSEPLLPDALDLASLKIEALSQAVAPVPQQFSADGRPLFTTDVEWARWLIEHPERVTAEDRKGLRDALRSPSFRLGLEMNGVAATALSNVLNDNLEVA